MKKTLPLFIMLILFGIINAHLLQGSNSPKANADIPQIVVSGAYGGGGNNGSIYKNDYVELYNTTSSDINLEGYTLYYISATGTSATVTNTYTFVAGDIILANSFALIKAAAGAGTQPVWPIDFDFDVSGASGSNFAMAAGSGKVLLLSAYQDLSTSGSIPNNLAGIQGMAGYVDYMPYGSTAVPVFGSSTVDLAAATAAKRKYDGVSITYTFNIGADFDIVPANEEAPRNSTYGSSNRVATPTFSPSGGTFTSPVEVTINCATEGVTIRYTLDGSDPLETSPEYSEKITVSATTTLQAKAWKDGMEPSLIGKAVYIFPIGVGTLAELRALAPAYGGNNVGDVVYTYTGQAVVTHKQNFNQRNVKYIQDGTAAIQIYEHAANLLSELEIGDKVTNIRGTLTNYFGMIELIPTEGCQIIGYSQQVPTTIITASQLNSSHTNPIQAKVITLKDVIYVQTGTFAQNTYYDLTENGIKYDSVVYTDNYATDYFGDAIPTVAVSINGICNYTYGKNRIVPLNKNNNVIQSISSFNKSAITLAPNPANCFVNIVTDSPMKLEVYSLIGNLITVENLHEGENTVSVSQLPAGLYLMKLTNKGTGETFVQKLVVQ